MGEGRTRIRKNNKVVNKSRLECKGLEEESGKLSR